MDEQTLTAESHDLELVDGPTGADRGLGLLMAFGGFIGTISAAILVIEKVNLLENPGKSLNCDVNPIVGCGNVINTDQASVFGFPNPIMGVAAFAILATLGVLLLARVALPTFVWVGLQVGVVFGLGFVTWLQYQSLYEINALCPYCMVVWSVTIPVALAVTIRNIRAWAPGAAISRFLGNWTVLIIALWYIGVIAAIWFRFGSDIFA